MYDPASHIHDRSVLPRCGLGNNDRPPTREVEVVDTEVRRAAELVVGDVVVHNNVAVGDRVMEDALTTRRVHIVVRAEHERSRGRVEVLRKVIAELAVEGAKAARATANEDLVLLASGRLGGSLK